ncbi:phosphoesterase family-domain-containing protein [Lactarius pseudohatsudake]|nr:phosphoesterase family-domain-containing protein [Lactarius pseudohatsudake]
MILTALLPFFSTAFVAQALTFKPPSTSPTAPSANYVGANNGTLPISPIVPGRSFDRFIQIWLENTDFATASAAPVFQSLASQGILLNKYFALTHPSEPNYVASVGGDYWGMANDNMFNIPSNIATIVDVLDTKSISWASYSENMPTDNFGGFNFASTNYVSGTGTYTYYVRKHNPLVIYDSVATNPSRATRIRNFNDFAADVNANAIPQWAFVTPNMVNDAHDTDVTYSSAWLNYWLVPLLSNPNFNNDRTLILLTFDENSNSGVNNQIWSVLLGGAVPTALQRDDRLDLLYALLLTQHGAGQLGTRLSRPVRYEQDARKRVFSRRFCRGLHQPGREPNSDPQQERHRARPAESEPGSRHSLSATGHLRCRSWRRARNCLMSIAQRAPPGRNQPPPNSSVGTGSEGFCEFV